MEAKELRAGNYLLSKEGKHKEIHFKVENITTNCYDVGLSLENVNGYELHEIRPIPLTEDWLIKFDALFGFNHCGSQYCIEYGLDCYNVRLSYDVGMSKFIGEVKYVHSLQNLYFALTGKELEV